MKTLILTAMILSASQAWAVPKGIVNFMECDQIIKRAGIAIVVQATLISTRPELSMEVYPEIEPVGGDPKRTEFEITKTARRYPLVFVEGVSDERERGGILQEMRLETDMRKSKKRNEHRAELTIKTTPAGSTKATTEIFAIGCWITTR